MQRSRGTLFSLAIVTGAVVVLVGNVATDLVLRRTPFADGTLGSIDAPDVAVLHILFTSIPMIVLALVGSRSRLLWSTAILLTSAFWAYFVYQIWRDSLIGFAGGANIGLGLIMIASPFAILLVLGLLALISRSGLDNRRVEP